MTVVTILSTVQSRVNQMSGGNVVTPPIGQESQITTIQVFLSAPPVILGNSYGSGSLSEVLSSGCF